MVKLALKVQGSKCEQHPRREALCFPALQLLIPSCGQKSKIVILSAAKNLRGGEKDEILHSAALRSE